MGKIIIKIIVRAKTVASSGHHTPFLQTIDNRALALLIEDADYRDEYNVSTWAADERLNAVTPESMKVDGRLTAATLKSFSKDFMHDARDAAKVHQYAASVNPERAKFNFDLRLFRQRNPWLLKNPTNDVQKDYFGRKLFIMGPKMLGIGATKVMSSSVIPFITAGGPALTVKNRSF